MSVYVLQQTYQKCVDDVHCAGLFIGNFATVSGFPVALFVSLECHKEGGEGEGLGWSNSSSSMLA